MKPEINRIYQGDCLEIIRSWPDNFIDAVITDPPWFTPTTHCQSRISWQRNYGDLSPLKVWWEVISKEIKRILKPTGHYITFCNGDSLAAFYPGIYSVFPKIDTLVWDKIRPGLGSIWRGQHELIIAARMEDSKRKDDGILRADVLRYEATPSAEREHPVEKPIKMLKALIDAVTLDGELVFDPYCGSGTTLVAAQDLERNWIGIDIDLKYVKSAEKRVAAEAAQGKLF